MKNTTLFLTVKNGQAVPVTDLFSEEVFNFQGSEEWHDFRAGKENGGNLWPAGAFGASSAAALMDEGYGGKDFQKLSLELSGFKKIPKAGGKAIQRGNDNEDLARGVAETVLGARFSPVCALNTLMPILRVSFDGVGFDQNGVPNSHVEIKIPTPEKYQELKETLTSEANCSEELHSYSYYYAQVQMQLSLIPTVPVGNLFIYSPEEKTYLNVRIPRNEGYIQRMIARLNDLHAEVHELVKGNVDEEDSSILSKLLVVKKKKDELYKAHSAADKEYKSLLKDDLTDAFEDRDVITNGLVSVSKTVTKGSVDWKAVVEAHLASQIESGEINLDEFLREPSPRYAVSEMIS